MNPRIRHSLWGTLIIISRARKTLNRGEVVTTRKSKKCSYNPRTAQFWLAGFFCGFWKKRWLNFFKIIRIFFFQNFEPTNSILASFLLNHRGRCVWRRHVIIIIINSWYYSCLSSIFFLVVSYLGLVFFSWNQFHKKKISCCCCRTWPFRYNLYSDLTKKKWRELWYY